MERCWHRDSRQKLSREVEVELDHLAVTMALERLARNRPAVVSSDFFRLVR